MVKKTKQ